jgi:hypothetical protein
MKLEWANGVDVHQKQGVQGASRFSAGAGRHGDFEKI